MTDFDLSRLGEWRALSFFTDTLPEMEARLAKERRHVLPPRAQVFRALELCQPGDTRVIILGQDPYHTRGKADGLAFSIAAGFGGRLDSLGNVFREIETDLGAVRTRTNLEDWAAQGVLLLNASALTVPEGQAKGHASFGWHRLVEQVLAQLASEPRAYLLWGRPAQQVARGVDPMRNLKIETAHPSPLSAHRGFLGARPFSRVNAWLQQRGKKAIHWADPEGA
ncbi:MAG: uracil-DNA glycosylase [Pseudomonadota bacterium]